MQQKIFAQFRDKTLEDFEVSDQADPTLAKAVEIVQEYIAHLPEMRAQGKGLTFVGKNGVGKTYLACMVLEAVMQHTPPWRTECIELSTFVEMHHDLFALGKLLPDYDMDYWKLKNRLDYIKGYPENPAAFTLLDDLGREHESASGWSSEIVFDVLRYRRNRNLPTLLTTNIPIHVNDGSPCLTDRYTLGLSSFLQEATIIIPMEGEDYRWRGAR